MERPFFIKYYREKAGKTQIDLSDLVGVHEMTLRRWEQGITQPRVEDIKKLCEVLKVSEAELLNGPQSKEWKIEVVFRKEEDWTMQTVDMSATAPNLFLVQVGMEKISLSLVGDPKDEAEVDSLWAKAKPTVMKMIKMRRELNEGVLSWRE